MARTAHDYLFPAALTPRTGYQYTFPIGLHKQDYPYYDSEARQTRSAKYIDSDRKIGGVRLYHFIFSFPSTDLARTIGPVATSTVTADKLGRPGKAPVTLDLHYAAVVDLWVDPISGAICDQRQAVDRKLVGPDGYSLTTLRANFAFDAQSQRAAVKKAKDADDLLTWGRLYGPAALAVLGLIACGGGVVAIYRRRTTNR